MFKIRNGIMVIGENGSGKSTVLNILAQSYQNIQQQTKTYKINPKSITTG